MTPFEKLFNQTIDNVRAAFNLPLLSEKEVDFKLKAPIKYHGRRLKAPVRNCGGKIKDGVCLRCGEYV